MGTSGAWGGSGGRDWSQLRAEIADQLDNPSSEGADGIVDGLLDALDWETDPDEEPAEEHGPTPPPVPPLPAPVRRSSGGSGGGGSGGGVIFGRPETPSGGGGRGGGSRRSRAGASRVAGDVLAAGLALRRGDADGLAELGLDLAELEGLSRLKQMQKILNALAGSGAAVEENELRQANAPALRVIFEEGLDGAAAVRAFLVEYVMQIYDSEAGETARDGSRSGQATLTLEQQVRSAVAMRVDQIKLPNNPVRKSELAKAIQTALAMMRRVRPK